MKLTKNILTILLFILIIISGCVMVLKDQAKIVVEKQVHGISVDNRINIDTLTKEESNETLD